jgi:carboxypeptidase Taq
MTPTILSPTERLGLTGAALESRVRRAAGHIDDTMLGRIAKRLADEAVKAEVVYERDGTLQPIPVMLRPLLAMNEQTAYVSLVCNQLLDALKRLPSLYLSDPAVRAAVAISPGEDAFLREMWTPEHARNNAVYGRLDAVCDFPAAAWQESLAFMEANLSGVGGISYSPLAEQLVMREIVPSLRAHDPGLEIELPRDQRDIFVQALIDHSRSVGRPGCRLCFVEPKYCEDGINEQAVLREFLGARHGLSIAHADPSELEIRNGEVCYEGQPVDILYRDYETRDLLALEDELGRKLDGMRLMFRENRVVSSLSGDFDHKSSFEVLTDPSIAERHFSSDECRLFRRHVLWTRVLSARRTMLPDHRDGDLLEYVRTHREFLVLKPNRSYGGEGVTIGASSTEAEWGRAMEEALAAGAEDPDYAFVVQAATRLPVAEFPVVGPTGRVFMEPFYAVMGFAPTEHGLGIMARVSQKQVVNVAQNGGMAAVLTAYPPAELTLPKRSLKRNEGVEADLRRQIAELQAVDNAIAALEWDQETALPSAAHDERGEQLAALASLRHAVLTSDSLGDLIEEVAASREGDPRWMRELELLRDLRADEIALPEDLVRATAIACARSQGAWEEAREANDFAVMREAFAETLRLSREMAQAADPGAAPYDTLLGDYEPGMTRAKLAPVFAELRERLAPMVQAAKGRAPAPPLEVATGQLRDFCREILESIGFDFTRGRLDRATHPGTSALGFDDVRLSLRAGESDLIGAVLTTLHEGGHGLYDQGYAAEDRGSLLANAPSMGLHEANARLWENHVGRHEGFWRWAMPQIEKRFPRAAKGRAPADFAALVGRVAPGLSRTNADEVSYHLHIILRTELETALVAGDLAVADLPAAWAERSRALLGVEPMTDNDGVLQDGHWAGGMFGYFPTYTIGSLYAAQLFEKFAGGRNVGADFAAGRFTPLRDFLRAAIHRHGDRRSADALVREATGEGLSAATFFRHVDARYLTR